MWKAIASRLFPSRRLREENEHLRAEVKVWKDDHQRMLEEYFKKDNDMKALRSDLGIAVECRRSTEQRFDKCREQLSALRELVAQMDKAIEAGC